MDAYDTEYTNDLTDRTKQINVLDTFIRDLSQTHGNTEEALQFWLGTMLAEDELPVWFEETDLDYMRRQLGIDE